MILSRLQFYWEFLRTDPVQFLIYILYYAVVILTSLILHECGHAYVAYRCGDPTAKMLGRLSLNPVKHLDPIGTACMVLMGFGWAKPVPVNPRNFRNYRRDDFLVSIAGITVNFTLFLFCLALAVGLNRFLWTDSVYYSFLDNGEMMELISPYADSNIGYSIAYYGSAGMFEGFLAVPWLIYVQRFLLQMTVVNLALAIFNFLPFPPLDGYHVFNDLILKGRFQLTPQQFSIFQIVLMALLFGGVLTGLLSWCNEHLYSAVLHLFLLITGAA